MSAETEREVRFALAADVEAIGIGETRLVAVGGTDAQHEIAAARNPRPVSTRGGLSAP